MYRKQIGRSKGPSFWSNAQKYQEFLLYYTYIFSTGGKPFHDYLEIACPPSWIVFMEELTHDVKVFVFNRKSGSKFVMKLDGPIRCDSGAV